MYLCYGESFELCEMCTTYCYEHSFSCKRGCNAYKAE